LSHSQKNGVSFILVPLRHPTSPDPHSDALFRISAPQNGVLFDIDADGMAEQVSWPADGSQVAFLAIDRNANGRIDDGSELCGAQSIPNASDGFTALDRIEDSKHDGSLTKKDSIFSRLLLWSDQNGNGLSESGELTPVGTTIAKFGLGYLSYDRTDKYGNNFVNRGWAVLVQDFNDRPNDPIVPTFEVFPMTKRTPR